MARERAFNSIDGRTRPCKSASSSRRKKVLFLCAQNAIRSQMAEAFLNCFYGDVYQAFSAGVVPSRVDPLAIDVMSEIGIDISLHRSKGVEEALDNFYDTIVTLCDCARDQCPIFPGTAELIHHEFPSPSSYDYTDRSESYRRVRDEIGTWVESAFGPSSPRYLAPPFEFS